MYEPEDRYYNLTSTLEVLLTSESGEKIANLQNYRFEKGKPDGNVILVKPDVVKQTIIGIGTSFTESSAFVLSHLDRETRLEVMNNIYGVNGANFSMARTPVAATDFSVEGRYSYDDVKDDDELKYFSIDPDWDGFDKDRYPGIRDASYDVLPMIKEALAIKNKQKDSSLRIIASAWTAPYWMKDIEDWYINGTAENNYQGTGGKLKQKYLRTYANYLIKYLDAYEQEGVTIWGLTPVNEPHGNNGQWESMHFTPESQNIFIKNHLGPALRSSGHGDTRLLIYDQNRDGLERWADVIFSDPETAGYVYGAAIHWYESSFRVFEDVLDRVHGKYPEYAIIHTEGTIDDLGKDAPQGILDPLRFKESGWFDNDEFWWNENATDWAYTATWPGVNADDHPIYTPVHRYARNIIVSLNHWVSGWIDWNIVLDKKGGPNHVGNYCGAPIMVDTSTGHVYYTPIYHVLSQFSRTIRPGDRAVQVDKYLLDVNSDAIHASASIGSNDVLSVQVLNTTNKPVKYMLQIGTQYAEVMIAANALQTLRVQL